MECPGYSFVAGDTGSVLQVTCTDTDGVVIDLTGAIVRLQWVDSAGADHSETMTLVDAVGGIASYQFAAGELEADYMAFEIEIEDGSGDILNNLEVIGESVRAPLV